MKRGLAPLLLTLLAGCAPIMAPRSTIPIGARGRIDMAAIHDRPAMHTDRHPLPVPLPQNVGNHVEVEPVKTSLPVVAYYGWGAWLGMLPSYSAPNTPIHVDPGIAGPEWFWWVGYQLPPLWPVTALSR